MGGGSNRSSFGFYVDGFPLDILCHVASALEAAAFLQVNFYYLRLIEISAMFLMAIYNLTVSQNFLDCHFIWAVIHFSIHTYRVWEILKKRLSSHLNEDDKKLYSSEFDIFSKAEFEVIRTKYEWVTLSKGFALCNAGEKNEYLYYIVEGSLDLENKAGDVFGRPNTPTWIGELGIFNEEAIASCTVKVGSQNLRAIRFKMNVTRQGIHKQGHDLSTHTYHKLSHLFIHNVIKTVDRLSSDIQFERSIHPEKSIEMEYTRTNNGGNINPSDNSLEKKGKSYLVQINQDV